jgi:hypothetical protein
MASAGHALKVVAFFAFCIWAQAADISPSGKVNFQPLTLNSPYEAVPLTSPQGLNDEYVKQMLPIAYTHTDLEILYLDENHQRYVTIRMTSSPEINWKTLYLVPSSSITFSQRLVDYLSRSADRMRAQTSLVKLWN